MIANGSAPDSVSASKTASILNTNSSVENEWSENKSKPGNLLTLVQPELVSLAHYWLAALRDYALLSLPPGNVSFFLLLIPFVLFYTKKKIFSNFKIVEFSSQLPHDGGAFYTTDTIELSRPYYAASWPPILLATSFWLNTDGFDVPRTIETKKNDTSIKDSAEDRFHLLFGKV